VTAAAAVSGISFIVVDIEGSFAYDRAASTCATTLYALCT
jgi:hypothetical protein